MVEFLAAVVLTLPSSQDLESEALLNKVLHFSSISLSNILQNDYSFIASRYDTDRYWDMPWEVPEYSIMHKKEGRFSALEALVSKGYKSVPYLLSQITSTSPSLLTLTGNDQVAIRPLTTYDLRDRLNGVAEESSEIPRQGKDTTSPTLNLTVTRGDIAFYALGQIVNRNYGTLDKRENSFLFFRLGNEVTKIQGMWKHLTSNQLKDSLMRDIFEPDSIARQTAGFARLRTYFPDDAVRVAVNCLNTSYGKRQLNGPKGFGSLFVELQPIACKSIDQACYKLLKDDGKGIIDSTIKETIVSDTLGYLCLRPQYLPLCISICKERTGKSSTRLGDPYLRFLKRYNQK